MSGKVIFSSNDLPGYLGERRKFSHWQEVHNEQIWSVEYEIASDRPFEANIEATALGDLVLGQMSGTIKHASRTARHIAKDGRDGHLLLVNLGDEALTGMQMGRGYSLGRGDAVLVSASEPLSMAGGDNNVWTNLVIPSHILTSAFQSIDDKLAVPIGAQHEALTLLAGYSRLLKTGGRLVSPDVIAHATATLVDLVGLATGAKGESAELAGLRGLRAARLSSILANIAANYTDPHFSALAIAQGLRLSLRYVHTLLQECGSSFSERVLELRLQRARATLGDRRFGSMRVSEIAYSAGFSDISYFNRRFRQRFGCTPGAAR